MSEMNQTRRRAEFSMGWHRKAGGGRERRVGGSARPGSARNQGVELGQTCRLVARRRHLRDDGAHAFDVDVVRVQAASLDVESVRELLREIEQALSRSDLTPVFEQELARARR